MMSHFVRAFGLSATTFVCQPQIDAPPPGQDLRGRQVPRASKLSLLGPLSIFLFLLFQEDKASISSGASTEEEQAGGVCLPEACLVHEDAWQVARRSCSPGVGYSVFVSGFQELL